jgi:hypothetical protein
MSIDITTIGIEFQTDGLKRGTSALADAEKAANKTADAADKAANSSRALSSVTDMLATAIKAATAAFGAYKLMTLAQEATLLAARYETLGVAMNQVGKNAGYTAQQMNEFAVGIQKSGISMVESRANITKMAQAHINLADASKLSRVAQDAAVIGNINSSEAFARMISGIQTGEVEVLRNIGIQVNFQAAYQKAAAQLKINAALLTEGEKAQARANAVMEKGKDIAGAYEASMGTAGKQLNSMTRYVEDLKVKMGNAFLEQFTNSVFGQADALKKLGAEMDRLASSGDVERFGHALATNIGTGTAILKDSVVWLYQHRTAVEAIAGAYATWKISAWLGPVIAQSAAATVSTVEYYAALASGRAVELGSAQAAAQRAAAALISADANVIATGSEVALTAARVNDLRATVLAAEGEVALAITTNGLIPAQAKAATAALAHAEALSAQSLAQTAAITTGEAAKISSMALGGAVSAMGGPIGVIIAALGLAATAWAVFGRAGKSAVEEINDEIGKGIAIAIRYKKEAQFGTGDAGQLAASLDAVNKRISVLSQSKGDGAAKMLKEAREQAGQLAKALESAQSAAPGATQGVGKSSGRLAMLATEYAPKASLAESLALLNREYAEEQRLANGNAEKLIEIQRQYEAAKKGMIEKLGKQEAASLNDSINAQIETLKKAQSLQEQITKQTVDKVTSEHKRGMVTDLNYINEVAEAEKKALSSAVSTAQAEFDLASKKSKNKKEMAALEGSVSQAQERLRSREMAQGYAILELNDKIDSERRKLYNDAINSSIGDLDSITEKNKATRLEIEAIGLTGEALARLTQARMDDTIAAQEQKIAAMKVFDDSSESLDAIKLEIDKLAQMRVSRELVGAKATKTEWVSIFDSIDRTAHDTFISIFDSGKNAFDRLRDTLKNGLFDLLYQMTIKKWIFSIGAAVSGAPGIANAAGTSVAGNAVGMASNGLSLYSAGSKVSGWLGMGGGTSAAAASSIEAAELGSLMTNSIGVEAALTAEVSTLSGMISSAVSAIPVWGWALAGAALFAKSLDHSGTYHTGSASTSSAAGTQAIDPRSLGFMQTVISADSQKITDGIASSVANILNSTATTFGKSAGYSAATAFADDTSKDGAWGALLINKMGEKLIDWDSNRQSRWAPREFADGAAGQQQYIAALSASVRTALDSIGLPSWAQKMLDSLGSAPTIEALSSVVDNINAAQKALVVMGETLTGFANLSDGTVSALIAASGGIQALAGSASSYYENFYTDAEKAANTTKQVTEALSKFGIAMPATREEFRAQVEAQLALGEAGAPSVAALLKVEGAFASITKSATTASDALSSLKTALSTAFSGLQKAVDAERTKLTKAYDDSLSTITKRIDKLRSLSDALNSSLGSRSTPGQFGEDYAQAQAQIMTAAVIARTGGVLPDASSLQKALATVAQPTEQLFATFTDYQRDFLKTSNSIKDLADLTDDQLSIEDKTLRALEDGYKDEISRLDGILSSAQLQVDAINGVNASVLTVANAIAAFNTTSKAAGGGAIGTPAGASANTGAGVASYDYVQAAVADASKYGQNAYAFIPGINDYAAKMDAASGLGARLGISAEDALQQSTGYSSSYWRAAQDAYDSLQHPTTTSIPGFAVGTSFVPQDMTARIHAGEEITPRPYVDMQRSDRERTNELLAQLVSENQSMRKTAELQQAAIDKIEKSSLKTAKYAEITYGEAQE